MQKLVGTFVQKSFVWGPYTTLSAVSSQRYQSRNASCSRPELQLDSVISSLHQSITKTLSVVLPTISALFSEQSSCWHLKCDCVVGQSAADMLFCGGYNYESTSIRRPFDCLSKVIKVTTTQPINYRWPASRNHSDTLI